MRRILPLTLAALLAVSFAASASAQTPPAKRPSTLKAPTLTPTGQVPPAAPKTVQAPEADPDANPETATRAPGPDRVQETYGAWTVHCTGGRDNCYADQGLYSKDGKTLLAKAVLFRPAGPGTRIELRTLTPLGASLKPGAVLQVDQGAENRVPYLTCVKRGCYAQTAMTDPLRDALKVGAKLAVAVLAPNGKTIRFEFSLDGAAATLGRLGVE